MELPIAQRTRYEGVYDLQRHTGEALPVHIEVGPNGLTSYAEGAGQGKFDLIYYGDDTFGAAFDPSLRLTVLFENGRAAKLRLQQGGGTLEGPRRP